MAGVVAASLIGIVYVAPITYTLIRILRPRKHLTALHRIHTTPPAIWTLTACLLTITAYIIPSTTLMDIATSNLVLSTLTLGTIIGARTLASLHPPTTNPALILSVRHFKQKPV